MRELLPKEREILDSLPQAREKPSATGVESLEKIQKARELGLAGAGMDDPLNQIMRYGFFKDLRRDMKRGDDEKLSTRDAIEYAVLMRMLPEQGGGAGSVQQIVADLKAENEKQRQFYETKLKEQEDRIREMVFEKKIETQANTMASLTAQLEDLNSRIEMIRSIPNATPEAKKDAITQLEEAGTQLKRIKNMLAEHGFIPPTETIHTSEKEQEIYRNPDGTVNKAMYLVDRITTAVERGLDTWQKKTPEQGDFVETPAPEKPKRPPTPEEYAEFLLSKPALSPQEQQWLGSYREELLRGQRRLPEAAQPAEQAGCRVCGNPEIYQNDFCERCWTDQYIPEQPKKSVVDRLKEQEEEEIRRTQGLL